MLRRLISLLATGAILFTGAVVLATPGHADTPGCVTKPEFQQAHKGMRKKHVHRMFDTNGRFLDGGAGGFARRYRFCDGAANAARTSTFTIIYAARRDGTNRVNTKYCGRDYNHRRSCF